MIDRLDLQLSEIARRISEREPFAFSRWGDGEWSAILGHGTQNCDGQRYTPELRRDLRGVLMSAPTHLLGIQALALRRFGDEIDAWLKQRQLAFCWTDAGVFHHASARDQLGPMLDALRTCDVLMVGPERLRQLDLFSAARHVVVPDTNCHTELERLTDETFRNAARMGRQVVVAISAGMTSNIIIHRVHQTLPSATLIDFGSVWEPYVSVANRTYHHKIIERLKRSKRLAV